jgi:hypothetical protein
MTEDDRQEHSEWLAAANSNYFMKDHTEEDALAGVRSLLQSSLEAWYQHRKVMPIAIGPRAAHKLLQLMDLQRFDITKLEMMEQAQDQVLIMSQRGLDHATAHRNTQRERLHNIRNALMFLRRVAAEQTIPPL